MKFMNNRVVITGIGVVCPIGINLAQFESSIKQGNSGIVIINELEELGLSCNIGGLVEISDKSEHLQNLKIFNASRSLRLCFDATLEAIGIASLQKIYNNEKKTDYDTGIILGSLGGQTDILETIFNKVNNGSFKKTRESIAEQGMFSGVSSVIAGLFGLGNCAITSSTACASSTDAIVSGYHKIKSGRAKRIISGGYDIYNKYTWAIFDILKIITPNFNNNPQKGSCPMSDCASGFVPGEGAGILILEDLDTAINRGAKILGEIVGVHSNSGGQRNGGTMSAPNPEGIIKCIQDCIAMSNVNYNDIELISGHLTSTMADVIEIQSWSKALNRTGKDFPYINALKSMTGHTIGAAGAIETIAGLLQMNGSFVHPTINCDEIHPKISDIIDESRIPRKTIKDININCFAKASFGFGDVNSCLIIKKFNL